MLVGLSGPNWYSARNPTCSGLNSECGSIECGSIECGSIERGSIECGSFECGSIECGLIECGSIECGSIECGSIERGLIECGLIECGSICYLVYLAILYMLLTLINPDVKPAQVTIMTRWGITKTALLNRAHMHASMLCIATISLYGDVTTPTAALCTAFPYMVM